MLYFDVIITIKHKDLRKFFENGDSSKVQPAHTKRLEVILTLLHAAKEVEDMNYPGSNLHKLSGSRKDFWSVNVSGNWRIVFRFVDSDAYDVDYLDYH